MNDKIREHLEQYAAKNDWGELDDDLMFDILFSERPLAIFDRDMHRWGEYFTAVVEIDGMILGFLSAQTTGDQDLEGMGYEFDPDTVREMETYQAMITQYRDKKE